MAEKSEVEAPQLPAGVSVFEPQARDEIVLRTPDDTVVMERDRARDLGRLLMARTEDD